MQLLESLNMPFHDWVAMSTVDWGWEWVADSFMRVAEMAQWVRAGDMAQWVKHLYKLEGLHLNPHKIRIGRYVLVTPALSAKKQADRAACSCLKK